MRTKDFIIFKITPPAFLDRKLSSTSQLISAIHNLKESGLSLEITSTKQSGITFYIRLASSQGLIIKNLLHAYLPEARVEEVEEYLSSDASEAYDFNQTNHFAYPLHNFDTNPDFDPISYITGAMTQLEGDQRISYQLIIRPKQVKEIPELQRRIIRNEELSSILVNKRSVRSAQVLNIVSKLLMGITDLITDGIHGPTHYSNYKKMRTIENNTLINSRQKPARQLSNFETELIDSINSKISQPQYEVSVRVILSNFSGNELKQRIDNFESAVKIYGVSGYQDFKKNKLNGSSDLTSRRSSKFVNIFSLSEIASLYHFPHSSGGKTENVINVISKTLPATVSLKDGSPLDVIVGVNKYHGIDTPIGLTEAERQRHMYIIGGTGNGKTTMLQYAVIQDIKAGKGLAVIDPHGDFAETILKHVPEDRTKDVIYINPDDLAYPVGVNLLEIPEGVSGDDLLREKDLITESVISVFRKIFSEDDSGGHRIEYVLRNSVLTALTLPDPTLFTVLKLLNNDSYRKEVVKTLTDEDLIDFWDNELGKAGEFQRVKMSAGITNKVGRFRQSAFAFRILSQPKSTIDFDNILDSNKILICNFSRGKLGEDNSTLFGTTILAKLQMAALRRARQEQSVRQPFYLYVDEFQHFATTSFIQMLSEARKYKLFLTIAEQSTAQQDEQRMVNIILANVGTVVCFRSSSPADEDFILPIFKPYLDEGEIANLPSYSFYIKIAAVNSQEPISGETLLLSDIGSEDVKQSVVTSSRLLYGKEYIEPEVVIKPQEVPKNNKTHKTSRKKSLSYSGKR